MASNILDRRRLLDLSLSRACLMAKIAIVVVLLFTNVKLFATARWGFINRSGDVVVQPQFANARSFYEGYAAVLMPGRLVSWTYIDKSGKNIGTGRFDSAGRFSEGLAFVRYWWVVGKDWSGKYGYINTKGMLVIEPQFGGNGATPFVKGLAAV